MIYTIKQKEGEIMELRVLRYFLAVAREDDGTRNIINTAYVVMVALDENERPVEVPRLKPETEEEKAEWEAAEKRSALRKQRRTEKF